MTNSQRLAALVAHPYGLAALEIIACRAWVTHDRAMQTAGTPLKNIHALRASANWATILLTEVERERARDRGRT